MISGSLTASQKFRTVATRPDLATSGLLNNNNNIMIVEEKTTSPVSLKVIDNESPRRMATKEEIITRTSGFDSEEHADFEGEVREYSVVAFEKWLCNSEICNNHSLLFTLFHSLADVPLISKDDEIMDLILKKENLEAFLMFLLDPRSCQISQVVLFY